MDISFETSAACSSNIFRPWISSDKQKTCVTVPVKHDKVESVQSTCKVISSCDKQSTNTLPYFNPMTSGQYLPGLQPWTYSELPPDPYFSPHYFDNMQLSYMINQHLQEEQLTKVLRARKQRPRKFKCPHCDVRFSNSGQLRGHVRIHTGWYY